MIHRFLWTNADKNLGCVFFCFLFVFVFVFLRTTSTEGLVDRKEVRGNIYPMGREIGGDVSLRLTSFCFYFSFMALRAKQQEVTGSDSEMEVDGTTGPRTDSGFTCTGQQLSAGQGFTVFCLCFRRLKEKFSQI